MNEKRCRSILYVDDDRDDWEILQLALKKIDASVQLHTAENGHLALQYLRNAKADNSLPQLIILDINMPVLNGKETHDQIRNVLGIQDVPIVIFTSRENIHDAAFFASTATELINKPFSPDRLYAISQRLVSNYLPNPSVFSAQDGKRKD